MVCSASLLFEDKTTLEFGGWAEFEAFRWTTPKVTKELRLRWNFLLAVQGYELPQQHALIVKLCSDAKPIELLQAMLSKHPAEDDGAHMNFAPTVVRVDFISHTIGQELISVVEQWNESLARPEARTGFFIDIDKHKEKIAAFIDYSTPVLFALASIGVLRKIYPSSEFSTPLTVGVGVGLMNWLICSLIAIYLSDKVSSLLAKSTYQAIDKYGMYSMFRMTNGDENRGQKIAKANKKQIRKFFVSTSFSFLLNVVSGILVAIYWPTGA